MKNLQWPIILILGKGDYSVPSMIRSKTHLEFFKNLYFHLLSSHPKITNGKP